jgi:hypothetical protein
MGDGFAIIMPCKQIEEGSVQAYYCWTFRLSMMLKKNNSKRNEPPFLALIQNGKTGELKIGQSSGGAQSYQLNMFLSADKKVHGHI